MVLAILLIAQCVAFAADTGWTDRGSNRFLFDQNGKKVTGWYQEGNDWYYMNYQGKMAKGWFRLTTGIYHADDDGKITEGWQRFKGIWYVMRKVNIGTEEEPEEVFRWFYVDGSDEMPFGKRELAGRTYNVENRKERLVGWKVHEEEKAYFNEDGTMDVGWKEIDGNLYYFDLTGRMVKSRKYYINGEYYTFTGKGLLKDETQAETVRASAGTGNKPETTKAPDSTTTSEKTQKPEETSSAATTSDTTKKTETTPSVTTPASNPTQKPEDTTTTTTTVEPTKKPDVTPTEKPAPVVTTKTETAEESVPYETEYQNDDTRYPEDGNKTIQAGKNGTKTITYSVTYTDGVETSREKTGETIPVSPVKEIISVPCKGHAVEVKEETKEETIAFTTETQNDDSRIEGEADQVIQEGVNGKIVTVYSVTYTDGVETGRVVKSENRTEPVKKIISHATGKKPTTTTKTVVETEEIPYTSTTENSSSMYKGETSVVQEGRNGAKDVTYEIVLDSNGNQISKTAVSETITKAMKPEIVYVGTFEPSFSYEYVTLDLSPWMHGTRSSSLDSSCAAQAMSMAQNGAVAHSGEHTAGESVGGWSSASAAASGVAAHGGDGLAWSEYWGVGCVKVTKTTPGGGAVVGYYACAQAGGGLLDGYPSQE